MPAKTPSARRRGCRKVVGIAIVLLLVLVSTLIYFLPQLLRHSEVNRDRDIALGSEIVHVKIVYSRNPEFMIPHGVDIGGGDERYDTSIAFRSSKIVLRTELQPRTIWSSHNRIFIACSDVTGGMWLIGEIVDGKLIKIPRASLPEPPPAWTLENSAPDVQAEFARDFDAWAK